MTTENNGASDATPSAPLTGVVVEDRKPEAVSVSAADLYPERTGILASVRSKNGAPVAQISDECRITIKGPDGKQVVTSVAGALYAGLLVKDPTAPEGYREPNDADRARAAEQAAAKEAEENKDKAPSGVPLDPETEKLVGNIMGAVQAEGHNPLAIVAELLANPTTLPKALETVGRMKGIDAEQCWRDIDHVWDRFHDQAASYIEGLGYDADEVFAFAEKTIPSSVLNAGRMAHFAAGSFDLYKTMVQRYAAAHGPAAATTTKLPEGAVIRKTAKGERYVEIPGVNVPIPYPIPANIARELKLR
jgi:hypothetical protein